MPHFNKASDIKVGVVGYGGAFNMGREHLTRMQGTGMLPVAVCEVAPERLAAAKDDFPGIQTFATVGEMLAASDVNLVTLITPHNTHAPIALQCLEAGRHVVCEKPLALTTAECDAMIAAARESKVVLTTYHNRHWDGCILRAVEQVRQQRAVGEVFKIRAHMAHYGKPGDWWRSSQSISGGILYDWGVHLLEYSLQLIESEVTEVSGYAHRGFWGPQTKWGADANEDEACAVVRFRNGAWLNLTMSSIESRPEEGWLEITGTEGTYLFDGSRYTLRRHRQGTDSIEQGPNPPSQQERYYENVRDHLVQGAPLVITPEWSRRPIHILDLAVQSAREGRALAARYG